MCCGHMVSHCPHPIQSLAFPNCSEKWLYNIYYPASGTIINPRPAMIMKTAPDMDNAKAFVDFLFSDEAQQLVADAYLLPGRTDIQCTNRTNVSDIPQLPTDWDVMVPVADETAANLNEICQ